MNKIFNYKIEIKMQGYEWQKATGEITLETLIEKIINNDTFEQISINEIDYNKKAFENKLNSKLTFNILNENLKKINSNLEKHTGYRDINFETWYKLNSNIKKFNHKEFNNLKEFKEFYINNIMFLFL